MKQPERRYLDAIPNKYRDYCDECYKNNILPMYFDEFEEELGKALEYCVSMDMVMAHLLMKSVS